MVGCWGLYGHERLVPKILEKKFVKVLFYPVVYDTIVKNDFGVKTMENCINEQEMLDAALETIEGFCKSYANKEMDQEAFCKALAEIPECLWTGKDSSLAMITALVENDDLYEFFQDKCESTPSVIGAMLPRIFWNNKENVLGAIELLIEILFRDFEYANCYEIECIFKNIPQEFWQDRVFALSVVDIISKWARGIEDLGSIDELIPSIVFDAPDKVDYTIISLAQSNNFDATNFYLYPTAAWGRTESIFLMLGYLVDALDGDSYNMYPTYRGSTQDYLESFLSNVPARFKKDKDFVLEFLGYDALSDGFEALYNWMDKSLWADKEVVMTILDNDFDLLERVSEELMEDEEFKQYLKENFDLD